jgi:glutamate-1-semialdehyde 2,1-aminomutase
MPNKISLNNSYPDINKSLDLYKKAKGLIPSVTQTLAKGPTQHIFGIAPVYVNKGRGSHVWDVDGNEYIDYNMGIGPVSLGYCYKEVDDAICEQLKDGITFSLMHPLEVEVAELISDIIPNAEAVRYSKTGADVTSAAVRLARAYTGKKKILCCGYHGWHDWYIAVTDRNAGVPEEMRELTYTFNYNDIDSVIDSIDDDIAGIILEPVVFEEPRDNFLNKLRDITKEKGIVLIFDEMWTGFRISTGGAQEYYGIKADLACYSKAIANGMPVSVLTGRREIMDLLDKEVFFFTTFGGEALSLAAARATINIIRNNDVPAYLSRQGGKLKYGLSALIKELKMDYMTCTGMNYRTIINFSASAGNPLEMKSLLQQELIRMGILWSGIQNISFSHSDEDIEYTLSAFREALIFLKKAVEEKDIAKYLRGKPVEPVFRKTGNFNTKPKILK